MKKVLYFADLRSSFAQDWILNHSELGDIDIIAVCSRTDLVWSPAPIATDFPHPHSAGAAGVRQMAPALGIELVNFIRTTRNADRLREISFKFEPDVVHSLRLTYESIVAASALKGVCHVGSAWGNDFTLHGSNRWTARRISHVLATLAGFSADADRDLQLAAACGLPEEAPRVFLPSSLGTPERFFGSERDVAVDRYSAGRTVFCYPRGIRGYARPDLFVEAVRGLVSDGLQIAAVMVGIPNFHAVRKQISDADLDGTILVLPSLTREHFARVLSSSDIVVSPTSHDGSPNSVLEAMAAGCYPVVSDLPGLRQWVRNNENGQLFDLNIASMTSAMLRAFGANRSIAVAENVAAVREVAGREANRNLLGDLHQAALNYFEHGRTPD